MLCCHVCIGIAIGAGVGVFAVMAVILVGVILVVLCCRVRHNSETYVGKS